MTDAATPFEHQASDPRAVAERQVAMLGRMAEAGLQIVMALRDQAVAPAGDPAPKVAEDIGLAYGRVSRAVRLTLALQTKILKDIETLEGSRSGDLAKAKDARRTRVQRIVERVIDAEHDDEETWDRLAQDSCDRLDNEDLFGDVLDRPISELVADICQALGLSPNWTRLALEAWAREEIQGGDIGEPLARMMAKAPEASGTASHPAAALHAASP